MSKNIEYEYRAILFVDLLGFKNKVNQSAFDKELLNKVFNAVNSLHKAKEDNYKEPMPGGKIGVEISSFSDSLVISKDIYEPGSFFYLLNMAYFAMVEIVANGFLARGAITVGQLYHNNKVIFGPAMNDVYLLESKCAIYPRIIIQKNIFENMILKDSLNGIGEDRKLYESLVQEDSDGLLFIDFLSKYHQMDDDAYLWILGKTKELIINGIKENQGNESVLQKYEWLKNYFNDSVDNLPSNDERVPSKIYE